ncbi:DUF4382 domain-containing protein [Hyalangium rubrum]|uniref:DUF4382 domain-containing protein n=1 Tax=Hyalangium rubrum TaxID=3103134 RepID=A0ABU5HG43_9BACT|nr:DUF4382 domain-containing protein [Hyalangium sp. s54d21]MDY7231040.1 DUF4382 domain-containing protein [Hyalangium sp. s54d21]
MYRMQILATFLFTLTLGLIGCGGESKVTIKLTDAPGDFKRAVVTISEVELLGEGENNRVVLLNEAKTTDLITLANDTADLVKDATVPAGTYKELRFVITGAFIEVEQEDGSTKIYASSPDYAGLPEGAQVAGELQMPSYGTSGLKVKIADPVAVEGEQKVILVDFDVAQSFGRQAGGSGRWVMSPVIKAAEITFSGTVTVTLTAGAGVTLPSQDGQQITLGQFKATLTNTGNSTETVAFTDANGDGTFEAQFKFLIPGDFSADILAPEGVSFATSPAHPAAVSVGSGKQVSVAFTLTSAEIR